ncbi:unnamed protein product, partial [Mesorhabditis spiculigera]
MCAYRLLLTAAMCALFTSSWGQTCADGATTGPCGAGLLPCATGTTCVGPSDNQLCCPTGSVIQATSTTVARTTRKTACVDKINPRAGVSDCPARAAAGYCTRKYYKSLMKQQCPKSCNFCTSSSNNSGSSSSCADLTNPRTGNSDCPRLSYLCSNSQYQSIMAVQCRKTCGLC